MKFCDLHCKYASFPDTDDVDGSRSCRTFVALYCKKKKSYVHKNLPCADKTERKDPLTDSAELKKPSPNKTTPKKQNTTAKPSPKKQNSTAKPSPAGRRK